MPVGYGFDIGARLREGMDSLIGAIMTVGLVVGYGGFVMVGLTDTPEPVVSGRFNVIAWDGDGDGAAEGAILEVLHLSPGRALLSMSMEGEAWERVAEAGAEVFIPCPDGDRWLVVESGGRVVAEHRVPPCGGGGGWEGSGEKPVAPAESGEDSGEDWCPDGTQYFNGFVCVPKVDV